MPTLHVHVIHILSWCLCASCYKCPPSVPFTQHLSFLFRPFTSHIISIVLYCIVTCSLSLSTIAPTVPLLLLLFLYLFFSLVFLHS